MTETEFLSCKKAVLRRFFSRMNAPQFQAVTTVQGPVLVLAGAGSGKTTVIVNRIANMILFGDACHSSTFLPSAEEFAELQAYSAGELELSLPELRDRIAAYPVRPWQILAITFTNKAAGELKSRLAETLGDEAQEIHAATFHSACVRMLRTCIERAGFNSNFTIYDTDDSLRTMKDVMKIQDVSEKKFPPKSILAAISSAKDRMLSPEDYAAEAGKDYWKSVVARLYKAYQQRLHDADALDFDDIIYYTVRIFEQNPDVLEKYQKRYRYILVDEYQDTNYAQYRLVSLLAQAHGNLCVVGDDDQSIYRFRGATIENILQFEEQFPGCMTVRLEENYRSTQHILDAANAVISHNENRKGKTLYTAAGAGEKVTLLKVMTEREEGDFIAEHIAEAVRNGKQYADFAVLYRMNALSNSVERSMIRHQIPYRVYGGIRFLDRKEVKDVLAYLCLLANPNDLVRFERIINVPKRGIGEATVANITQIAQDLHLSPMDVLRNCGDFPVLAKRSTALLRFSSLMDEIAEKSETLPLEEVFDLIVEKSGYLDMLRAEGKDGEERIENVKELRSNVVSYTKDNEQPTLSGFLEETALYTDADRVQNENSVSLMTMHSAKGLEFDTVFAVGMETGIFPGMRSFDTQADMEEERRLAYVTITRAKRHMYLSHAQTRLLFGMTRSNPLSQFVREIPEDFRQTKDCIPKSSGAKQSFSGVSSASGSRSQMEAIRRQRTVPASTSPGAGLSVKAGDRIADQVFGEGTVLRAEAMGGDMMLEIAFDTVGTKKLMAKYRKLKKL